jgi:hypothetical protein
MPATNAETPHPSILDQIMKRQELTTEFQHAYREGHSTITALTQMT